LSGRSKPTLKPKPAKEPVCFQRFLPMLKKLNLLRQKNGITENENISQTIDRQERPVGNKG